MMLFKTTRGVIFSFGFDVANSQEDENCIAWNDPVTKEWDERPTNVAGRMKMDHIVDPEFIHECDDKVIVYQPGLCLEIYPIGPPMVFGVRVLTPETNHAATSPARR